MNSKSPLPKRPRLSGFDYSGGGYYFVTFVTNFRTCSLSRIINCKIILSDLGKIVEIDLSKIPDRFSHISVDSYAIMPNHVHVLFFFNHNERFVSLSRIVNEVKSRTSLQYNKLIGRHKTIWQYGYYDTVIRSEKQLYSVKQYIRDNPIKWELDELNPFNKKS